MVDFHDMRAKYTAFWQRHNDLRQSFPARVYEWRMKWFDMINKAEIDAAKRADSDYRDGNEPETERI